MTKAIQCVGIVCLRGDQVLLVRRGKAPKAGQWSIPGGRIEYGESETQAAMRELTEETAVRARLGPKIALVKADFDGTAYDLHDYVAEWISGEPIAGDDAKAAQFFDLDAIDDLGLWDKTREIIALAHKHAKTANF